MIPHNAQKACDLAVENGWRATFQEGARPTSVALKLEHDATPRVWAIWQDGRFWRSYAQTCQRLSYRDLLEVIAQPELLIPEDSEFPFGKPEGETA